MAQWLSNLTSIYEDVVGSLALLSGLRIQRCHRLWCRSQMLLGSCIAVAVAQASGCSSNSTLRPLGWEPPYAVGVVLKRQKKKKKKEGIQNIYSVYDCCGRVCVYVCVCVHTQCGRMFQGGRIIVMVPCILIQSVFSLAHIPVGPGLLKI